MTTNDIFHKLDGPERIERCAVCKIWRLVEYQDREVGVVCEPCMVELRMVDIMLNCDLPLGLCRPNLSL